MNGRTEKRRLHMPKTDKIKTEYRLHFRFLIKGGMIFLKRGGVQ